MLLGRRTVLATALVVGSLSIVAARQEPQPPQPAARAADDPVRMLVSRLDLEKYKATIKGLTQFGDRREGTERNRKAVDWIEAQLKSYGCTNTERIKYEVVARGTGGGGNRGGGAGRGGAGRGGDPARVPAGTPDDPVRRGAGGKGFGGRTGVNNDPNAQPDVKLRELNMGPVLPEPREEVYCTKIGSKIPGEMYIIGAHMDGIGYGQAANDDGSGTAIVMELARIFNSPEVETERSIRFALWNGEEGGLRGSRAYVEQRRPLQGKEIRPDPENSPNRNGSAWFSTT